MPRFDASLTKAGSGAWMRRITGHAASCTISSIRARACSELLPRPTRATSGCSLAVTTPTSGTSISLAITSCPRFATVGATSASRSLRSLAISTRRCSVSRYLIDGPISPKSSSWEAPVEGRLHPGVDWLLRFASKSRRASLSGSDPRPVCRRNDLKVCAYNHQTLGAHMSVMTEKSADATAIRPLKGAIPQADLDDLRARVVATRFPEKETVDDLSQGPPLATMQALARYWADEYDWSMCEEKLDALPHFMTEIDGLDIHFIHVRSDHEDALPLIVTHGWPGSIVEQLKIIDPLTNPTAHGGSASDAFDVVIPSMPGYGYSGKPTTTGWDVAHIARAWVVLMKRLGYAKFAAQGGDWGAVIVDAMGLQAPPELLGIHTNMPGIFPVDIDKAAFSGAPAPSGLSADEKLAYDRLQFVYQKGIAYGFQMGLRPQTLYGIADSPVGLAAWMLDHDPKSYELIARAFSGNPGGLSRDDVLDNVTLYWLTNTGISSARLYWENKFGFFNVQGVKIPVGVSVFPDELYEAPRTWAEQAYPKLIHYNRLPVGGHFAAWEQPALFSDEMRATFRSLR